MNARIIRALVAKDILLFFRNRIFAYASLGGIVAYAGIYFVMPREVNETLEMGLYEPSDPPLFQQEMTGEAVILKKMESEEALKQAILDREFKVGVALGPDFSRKLRSGEKGTMKLFFSSDFPEEIKETYIIIMKEFSSALGGMALNIDTTEEILGVDRAGAQIPPRDRMRPLMALIMLMLETMGLAMLITEERVRHTLGALIVTPMRIGDFFIGKGISGVGLAFIQAAAIVAVTGGLRVNPLLILLVLLLGALLVTGVGFLMASVSKDIMSVMGWGGLAIVILSLPAINIIMPGLVTGWVKAIPSFYVFDTMDDVMNYGAGWGSVWPNLLVLVAFDAAILVTGAAVLRRKMI